MSDMEQIVTVDIYAGIFRPDLRPSLDPPSTSDAGLFQSIFITIRVIAILRG